MNAPKRKRKKRKNNMKFELPIYDSKTGEVKKIHGRKFVPLDLYLKFEKFAEGLSENNYKNDGEFFCDIEDLMLDLFPDMTSEEYHGNVDVGEALAVFNSVLSKSKQLPRGSSSKNV